MNNSKKQNDVALERVKQSIKDLKENKFTFYFFVVDCKNVPNGNIAYIYEMAKTLKDKGYNVKMLYQLEDEYTEAEIYKLKKKDEQIDMRRVFVGVKEWLGNEYASLPHMNISTEEWTVSPSDFLFIPEVFSSLMFETYKHKIPCKRYVILQNYDYVTEFIPLGVEWKNYGIYDAITTSEKQSEMIKNVFPYMKTNVLSPHISEEFRKPIMPKKLVVNIVSKEQKDINRIIKPFYWKYPMYKFISFRDIRNFPREKYAELLKEGIITVWVDKETPFGYSALEAMRCDNIVIGKIPETVPEWMEDNEGIINNGLWVYNINDIPDVLAKAIASWMQNSVPSQLIDDMTNTNKRYTLDEWNKNIDKVFNNIIDEQMNTFIEVQQTIEQNNK